MPLTVPFDFRDFSRTDVRCAEALSIKETLSGANHLILASSAHCGKTTLIRTTAAALARPLVEIDGRSAAGLTDLSALILKGAFRLNCPEAFRQSLLRFHRIPSITTDLMTGRVTVSFATDTNPAQLLEDSLQLLVSLSTPGNRLIVFWRDFPAVLEIAPHLDRKLRAVLETQENISHVFTGSPERRMADIFERATSPFFHFGRWLPLSPLPEGEVRPILAEHFRPIVSEETAQRLALDLLHAIGPHPYPLRQAAETLYRLLLTERSSDTDAVQRAIEEVIRQHAWDYERLWDSFSQSQKKVLQLIVADRPFAGLLDFPATTLYSAAQKLVKAGILIKTPAFAVEDPFLHQWIQLQLLV